MSRHEEYLAKLDEARREVDRVSDPELKAVWRRIADGWADMARQVEALDGAPQRTEPGSGA